MATTATSKVISNLTIGALFFGMQSCEYSLVTGKRKTETLRVQDIRFFSHRRQVVTSTDMDVNQITSVTIDFHKTKNGDKEASITMHRTNTDLCLVRAWADTCVRILRYHNTSPSTTVNYVEAHGKPKHITSTNVLSVIRLAVSLIGSHDLGFGPDDVGTHSIRSSFAMFLYLSSIRSDKIMLQGRWKSIAFLSYIRPQVHEFSSGLSAAMTRADDFFTIPDHFQNTTETHIMQNPTDPLLRSELDVSSPPTNGLRYNQDTLLLQTRGRFEHLLWV